MPMKPASPYVANEADAITTWFVDEAGDPALFAKGGKVVAATDGCSRFFIEGKLECRDVDALADDLNRLRAELMTDPYFKSVPSLDPARRRTAVNFHAKDDPAEVRFLVFKLLARHELRFVAVVRDKLKLLDYATQRRRIEPTYRYNPNGHELYDELTRRLFHDCMAMASIAWCLPSGVTSRAPERSWRLSSMKTMSWSLPWG